MTATSAQRPPKPRPSLPVLRRLVLFLLPQRWPLLAGMAALAGASALRLAVAPLAQRLVNRMMAAAGTGHVETLAWSLGLVFAVLLGRALLLFCQTYLLHGALQRMAARLRAAVFEQTLRLSHATLDGRPSGELLAVLTNDIPALEYYLTGSIAQLVTAPLTLVGGIVWLFIVNWQLSLLLLLSLPPTGWLVVVAGRKRRRAQAEVQQTAAAVTAVAQERIAGARTIKAFGAEAREEARFAGVNDAALAAMSRSNLIQAAVPASIESIAAIAFIAVLGYASWQVVSGTLRFDVGAFLALVLLLERVSHGARQAGSISMSLGQVSATAERVWRFLDLPAAVQERPGAREIGDWRLEIGGTPPGISNLQSPISKIEFDRVTFGYSPAAPVLSDFSCCIPAGAVVALVGRSGAGKSTITALIPRFYDVQQGAVRIDGHDVRDLTLTSLRAAIAVVPQEVHLFTGSVHENIAYGRPSATDAETVAAAKAANAHDFILELPEGYDTEVGERGVRLSGGQRQRLAIARAVLRDPAILLLDEATASLDSESEALVQEALERLMVGRTTVVIAHRLSTIRRADTILVIEEGRIVERGTHDALRREQGHYARMWETQFSGAR